MAIASKAALGLLSSNLHRVPASQVKQDGWKGLMKFVSKAGAVIVTNHNEPQAVVVGFDEFEAMRDAALRADLRDELTLETLRLKFDERLAGLQQEGASDRLRNLVHKPVKLKGRVKAGTGF